MKAENMYSYHFVKDVNVFFEEEKSGEIMERGKNCLLPKFLQKSVL